MEFYLATNQKASEKDERQFYGKNNLLLSYSLESFITANSEKTIAVFTRSEEVEAELKSIEGQAIVVQPSESKLPLVRIDQCNWRIIDEGYGIVVEFYHQPHEINRMLASDCNSNNRFRSDYWRSE